MFSILPSAVPAHQLANPALDRGSHTRFSAAMPEQVDNTSCPAGVYGAAAEQFAEVGAQH